MKTFLLFIIRGITPLIFLFAACGNFGFAASATILLQAEDAALDPARVDVVDQGSFKSGKGVSLKDGVEAQVDAVDAPADITFTVKSPAAGRYVVSSHAAVDSVGKALMEKAKTKHDSIFMKIAVGNARPTRRVVFVPWSAPESCSQTTGKFDLVAGEQQVRVWLPKHVRLDFLQFTPYTPPKVPEKAEIYKPKVVPPATHPRLWVNSESLAGVRANLTKGENADAWNKVQRQADLPYAFTPRADGGAEYDPALEEAAVNKAFVYLMTGDRQKGREAVELVHNYLVAVEFGNLLDITREIGRAIYAGARVYDWCYDLMTEQERTSIRQNMMRLADDMEIGWPPFKQSVVNGHGSEAQLLCHLLSMAIAVYGEDPVPYNLCSYRILEELVPMRAFEYQSPRHHQGIGYGIYRFGWDMHAAWLLYRMAGEKMFDSNIEDVHKYWLYTRVPGNSSFADGDGNVDGRIRMGTTGLLAAAYSRDPVMKFDFLNAGGLPSDPILNLLVNDPDLEPAQGFDSLPLSLDYGPILGGMVARTGWNMDKGSTDVVVMMTGGGYHFDNHQHADAGSFQVYYHGMQVGDLGQYVFYGTPYDYNFNKASVAHSMMLAYDPSDRRTGSRINGGGQKFVSPSPANVKAVKTDPRYDNGSIISSDFGPSADRPDYNYFSVNLTDAYGEKLKDYVRSFVFLNLENAETPAALIVLDNMITSGPEVKKYWQVNTLNAPTTAPGGLLLSSRDGSGKTGYVSLRMLRPAEAHRHVEVLSGKNSTNVFGHQFTPPKPDGVQAKGHRVMFSPVESNAEDVFLTVMTMSEKKQTSVPVEVVELPDAFALTVGRQAVVLGKTGKLLTREFYVDTAPGTDQLILAGLDAGKWIVRDRSTDAGWPVVVKAGNNSACVDVPPGQYIVQRED